MNECWYMQSLVRCDGELKAESCAMNELEQRVGVICMQIRFKKVKNWFNRGSTQHVSLFLHRKRPGSQTSEAIQVTSGQECTNISEKIIIAQAVNSTLAKLRPITDEEE
jgi:hypothetical protein